MTVYILFFIFHVIIYGPRVCNKHLNNVVYENSYRLNSKPYNTVLMNKCFVMHALYGIPNTNQCLNCFNSLTIRQQ